MARGCAIADQLFPGLVSEWLENGACKVDMVREFRMQSHGISVTPVARKELDLNPFVTGLMLPKEERDKEGDTIYGVAMTRPFMEYHLRRRLLAGSSNVQLLSVSPTQQCAILLTWGIQKTRLVRLLYDAKKSAVTGVVINGRKSSIDGEKGEGGGETELPADVVVCAAGRRNHIEKWLKDIKVVEEGESIPQEMANPGMGYVTSTWVPPEGKCWAPI